MKWRYYCWLLIIFGWAGVTHAQTDPITLTVNTAEIQHTISPLIYGVNFATPEQKTAWNIPINRWGGNAVSRYNWQIDVYNPGNYWFYKNINNPDTGTLPNGSSADLFIEANRQFNAQSLMLIPSLGWVAKDRSESCGFHVDKYGPSNKIDTEGNSGCGDGYLPDSNQFITGNDPSDTSIAVGPEFFRGWIEHLVGRFGRARDEGIGYYAVSNEPMIWHHNHRDVHPEPASYDEVFTKNRDQAVMIKSVDPDAKVMGPGPWGWYPAHYSGVDAENFLATGRYIDQEAHGNLPFLAWYLQQMHQFEQENGYRLLDYLDVHYYPQVVDPDQQKALAVGPAGSADVQAARLRSTAELWDPHHVAESWINEPTYFIPLLQGWIDQYYPNTKIAITEYRWGGSEHINGALALADVLGIFGREDVGLATLWDAPKLGEPGDFAMRLFRNYDGAGGQFGNLSLAAHSSDPYALSIFAARRQLDGAVTIMVINKSGKSLQSTIELTGKLPSKAQIYRYSSADLSQIDSLPGQLITNGAWTTTFPADSITLYLLYPPIYRPIPTLR